MHQTFDAALEINLLHANQEGANHNRSHFDEWGITCFNLMSSPGAGKTALLEKTLAQLNQDLKMLVIEGDMTTELDAERLRNYDIPVIAINTGRSCHLDSRMVAGGFLFEAFLGTSYVGGVMLISIIVLIYTASGGLFAVAYTDAIQVSIAVLATIFLFGFILFNYGITIPEGLGSFDLGQLADPAQGAAINWATLLALGLGDIVAIDFND